MRTQRFTAMGSLCSRGWSGDWIGQVEALEARMGRRVCGALLHPFSEPKDPDILGEVRAADGSVVALVEPGPCPLEPAGQSGRCPLHGGGGCSGAPAGNSNARIHGIYQQRLQVCGPQCALWNSCPMAGDDVAALEPQARPTCYYEQTEFNLLAIQFLNAKPVLETAGGVEYCTGVEPPSPEEVPNAEAWYRLILLRVLASRAAAILAHQPLVVDASTQPRGRRLYESKMNALLTAYLRLSREYRRLYASLVGREPRGKRSRAKRAR